MSSHDDHFGEFAPHTKLKHLVLSEYLEAWAFKLLQARHAGSRAWFLDAFAGRGRDSVGNDGSPTIACRAAIKVRSVMMRNPRLQNQRLGVYCIEARADHFAALDAHLDPFRRVEPALVKVMPGSLDSHLDDVLRSTGGPILAFLDPFGIKGLDASTYAPLLARSGSEIFALIGTEGSRRLAAAHQYSGNKHARAIERATSNLPLFPDDEEELLRTLERQRDGQDTRNAENRTKNFESLTRALGSPERTAWVLEGPAEAAPSRTAAAFRDALFDAGALHVTVLPVSDADGKPKHLLVHATKSEKGVLAMKDAISHALRDETLPYGLRARVRDDLSLDTECIVAAIREAYCGQSAPWARSLSESVQDTLYVHSPAFPHHREEIESALKAAGLLRRAGRKLLIEVRPN